MLRMAMAQWRVRARRSLALLSMIAVAVVGFTVLTGAAVTARLTTVGAVAANYRPAYDILVRPKGSVLPLEQQRGLVQSGQLAGLRGGISTQAWQQIRELRDVSVAAPVAMVGYLMRTVPVRVDLRGQLDPAAERQVLRVRPTWVTDRGLSRIPDGPAFLYATRNPLDQKQYDDLPAGTPPPAPREVDPDGRRVPVCPLVTVVDHDDLLDPTDLRGRSSLTCTGGPGSRTGTGEPTTPAVTLAWSVPFLMAAVDPESEAALAGLDGAVTSGRYFTAGEQPVEHRLTGMPYPYASLPILVADRPQLDARLELTVDRLAPGAVDAVRSTVDSPRLRADLTKRPGSAVDHRTVTVDGPYREMVGRLREPAADRLEDSASADTLWLSRFWTVGPPETEPDGDGLRAERVPHDRKLWGVGADDGGSGHPVPMEFADTGVRAGVAVHTNTPPVALRPGDVSMPDVALDAVGTFDPGRVNLGGALSAVPMDTYANPGAAGADEASRRALGGGRLEPNANVTGLLGQPPLLLTTMAALPRLLGAGRYRTEPDYPEYQLNGAAPISMVRVRLAGEVGIDPVSRERVRLVAQQIAERTGLQVDITLGSSPTPVTVHYPAGDYGRPELALAEPWVRKGWRRSWSGPPTARASCCRRWCSRCARSPC
ncbi:hypothetical protein [Micromonospora zhanjiangensis]